MCNFSRINPLALDLMEPSVKQNVTTSSVLLKSSTQLYLILLHYIKLHLKESTDFPLGALSRSVSSGCPLLLVYLNQCVLHQQQSQGGDQIHNIIIQGGLNKDHKPTKSIYTCSVSAPLQSCVRSSPEAKLEGTSLVDKASVWRRVANSLVDSFTCESFHDRLLAIGGKDPEKYSIAVCMYNLTTNSWEIISHMATARYHCFTAVLPDNQLMAAGGYTDNGSTDTVELAIYSV